MEFRECIYLGSSWDLVLVFLWKAYSILLFWCYRIGQVLGSIYKTRGEMNLRHLRLQFITRTTGKKKRNTVIHLNLNNYLSYFMANNSDCTTYHTMLILL